MVYSPEHTHFEWNANFKFNELLMTTTNKLIYSITPSIVSIDAKNKCTSFASGMNAIAWCARHATRSRKQHQQTATNYNSCITCMHHNNQTQAEMMHESNALAWYCHRSSLFLFNFRENVSVRYYRMGTRSCSNQSQSLMEMQMMRIRYGLCG